MMLLLGSIAGVAGAAATVGCHTCSVRLSPYLSSSYPTLSKKDKFEWNSKIGHIFHAVTVTILIALCFSNGSDFDWRSAQSCPGSAAVFPTPVLTAVTPLSVFLFAFSLGYFLVDTCTMLLVGDPLHPMVLHHTIAAASLMGTMATRSCQFYGLLLLSTEVTTPFISFRWFLLKTKRARSQLYVLNGVCILVGWLFSRVLLFIFMFVHMWTHWSTIATFHAIVRIMLPIICAILFAMNLYWLGLICAGFWRTFATRPKEA